MVKTEYKHQKEEIWLTNQDVKRGNKKFLLDDIHG